MNKMIDRREMNYLEQEYLELALAVLTDDIDCSISTIRSRNERLDEIEEMVGEDICSEWFNKAEEQAKERGYASGAIYEA
jgi:hypothetical protein